MSNSNIVNCSLVAANGAANLSVNFEDVPGLGAEVTPGRNFTAGRLEQATASQFD